jgi:hypothetical protein
VEAAAFGAEDSGQALKQDLPVVRSDASRRKVLSGWRDPAETREHQRMEQRVFESKVLVLCPCCSLKVHSAYLVGEGFVGP